MAVWFTQLTIIVLPTPELTAFSKDAAAVKALCKLLLRRYPLYLSGPTVKGGGAAAAGAAHQALLVEAIATAMATAMKPLMEKLENNTKSILGEIKEQSKPESHGQIRFKEAVVQLVSFCLRLLSSSPPTPRTHAHEHDTKCCYCCAEQRQRQAATPGSTARRTGRHGCRGACSFGG